MPRRLHWHKTIIYRIKKGSVSTCLPTFFSVGMTYDKQILQILTDVGEQGISVLSLAKHVYNLNRTFFSTPDLEEIRSYVQQYLLKNSKSSQSLIESTGRRGFYRLNTNNNADAQQLMILFREERQDEENDVTPTQDLSLSLFD